MPNKAPCVEKLYLKVLINYISAGEKLDHLDVTNQYAEVLKDEGAKVEDVVNTYVDAERYIKNCIYPHNRSQSGSEGEHELVRQLEFGEFDLLSRIEVLHRTVLSDRNLILMSAMITSFRSVAFWKIVYMGCGRRDSVRGFNLDILDEALRVLGEDARAFPDEHVLFDYNPVKFLRLFESSMLAGCWQSNEAYMPSRQVAERAVTRYSKAVSVLSELEPDDLNESSDAYEGEYFDYEDMSIEAERNVSIARGLYRDASKALEALSMGAERAMSDIDLNDLDTSPFAMLNRMRVPDLDIMILAPGAESREYGIGIRRDGAGMCSATGVTQDEMKLYAEASIRRCQRTLAGTSSRVPSVDYPRRIDHTLEKQQHVSLLNTKIYVLDNVMSAVRLACACARALRAGRCPTLADIDSYPDLESTYGPSKADVIDLMVGARQLNGTEEEYDAVLPSLQEASGSSGIDVMINMCGDIIARDLGLRWRVEIVKTSQIHGWAVRLASKKGVLEELSLEGYLFLHILMGASVPGSSVLFRDRLSEVGYEMRRSHTWMGGLEGMTAVRLKMGINLDNCREKTCHWTLTRPDASYAQNTDWQFTEYTASRVTERYDACVEAVGEWMRMAYAARSKVKDSRPHMLVLSDAVNVASSSDGGEFMDRTDGTALLIDKCIHKRADIIHNWRSEHCEAQYVLKRSDRLYVASLASANIIMAGELTQGVCGAYNLPHVWFGGEIGLEYSANGRFSYASNAVIRPYHGSVGMNIVHTDVDTVVDVAALRTGMDVLYEATGVPMSLINAHAAVASLRAGTPQEAGAGVNVPQYTQFEKWAADMFKKVGEWFSAPGDMPRDASHGPTRALDALWHRSQIRRHGIVKSAEGADELINNLCESVLSTVKESGSLNTEALLRLLDVLQMRASMSIDMVLGGCVKNLRIELQPNAQLPITHSVAKESVSTVGTSVVLTSAPLCFTGSGHPSAVLNDPNTGALLAAVPLDPAKPLGAYVAGSGGTLYLNTAAAAEFNGYPSMEADLQLAAEVSERRLGVKFLIDSSNVVRHRSKPQHIPPGDTGSARIQANLKLNNLLDTIHRACIADGEFAATWLDVVQALQAARAAKSAFVRPTDRTRQGSGYIIEELISED